MKLIQVLLLLAFISTPLFARANELVFEENRTLDTVLRIDGRFIQRTYPNGTFPIGKPVPIYYQFTGLLGDLETSLEHEEELRSRFEEHIHTHKTYLQVWRGVPHQDAELLEQWDISGTIAGIHMYVFPEYGNYFIASVMTEQRINEPCSETAECAAPYSTSELNQYFKGPAGDSSITHAPLAYGGYRFAAPPDKAGSNILFLPGIKGSRLYINEEKVWEPGKDEDVQKLFLAEDGSSLEDVYTESSDVVENVLFKDVYGSFIRRLEDTKESGIIQDWKTFSYDWRLSIPALLSQGSAEGNRTYFSRTSSTSPLLQTLKDLAANSFTHKVTIVAHSNGGLLAKALLEYLGDQEVRRFIDNVILIGTPQLGAPQAIGALLYGYREGIPWQLPFMVSNKTARAFGENAPMAYHLLPSEPYLDSSLTPAIQFEGPSEYPLETSAYGTYIDSFAELKSFLLAKEGGRDKPSISAVWRANVLNSDLLTYASDLHSALDYIDIPTGIHIFEIAGIGTETMSGIRYYKECVLLVCVPRYRPEFIDEGDGVVPEISALHLPAAEKYWVDLSKYPGLLPNKDHGTLLSIPEIQDAVIDIASSKEVAQTEHMTHARPIIEPAHRFRIFLHSPLTMLAKNTKGQKVGLTPLGELLEEIPNADCGEFGEVKFISLPGDDEYHLILDGYDKGTFTLEIEEVLGEEIINTLAFSQQPVSENTVASIDISSELSSTTELIIEVSDDTQLEVLQPSSSFSKKSGEILPAIISEAIYAPSSIAVGPSSSTTTDHWTEEFSQIHSGGSCYRPIEARSTYSSFLDVLRKFISFLLFGIPA